MKNVPVLHAGLQVKVSMNRPQPLYDVDTQPLEHLEDKGRLESVCVCAMISVSDTMITAGTGQRNE